MAHHHHHHGGIGEARGDRLLLLAIAINLALTGAEVAGGLLAGSLALVADAIHNLSDAAGLILALWARRVARRPASAAMTFGWRRAEFLAALANLIALALMALWLIAEAVGRMAAPPEVAGGLMMAIAALALAVDLGTAALTFAMARGSANIRAAFLHNLGDAAGSVAVLAGGAIIMATGWRLADPLITIALSLGMIWLALREMRPVARVLMLGAAPELDADRIARAMAEMPGVASVHHLHLWQLGEHGHSLEAHVVLEPSAWPRQQELRLGLRRLLAERFGIGHVTLEFEDQTHACPDARTIGGSGGAQASACAGSTG